MKKGTNVAMDIENEAIYGETIEDAKPSPIERNPNRMVIRVRWEDGSESIEDCNDLY